MVTAQYPANIMKINPLKTSSVAAYTELSVIPPSRLQKDCTIVILANNAPKETIKEAKFQDYHYYFLFQDIVVVFFRYTLDREIHQSIFCKITLYK